MTNWTEIEKYEKQTAIIYNDTNTQYNDPQTTYNGKKKTIWTKENKS